MKKPMFNTPCPDSDIAEGVTKEDMKKAIRKSQLKPKTIDEYCGQKPGSFKEFVETHKDPDKEALEAKQKPKIIQNAIAILEDFPNVIYLVSSHVHDFKEHVFKDGSTVFVDGGCDYIRRGGDISGYANKWVEFSLDESCPFDYLKYRLLWGTRGKDGKQKLKYVLLKDCETEHLQAILDYKTPNGHSVNGTIYERVIKDILSDRKIK